MRYEVEINPTTNLCENSIPNVVVIEDQILKDTPDCMDDDSFDMGSSFDLFLGHFEEKLDNTDNLSFHGMANFFQEPLQIHPYDSETLALSNFQPLLPTESHTCPSIALPLELELPEPLHPNLEHGESMDSVIPPEGG